MRADTMEHDAAQRTAGDEPALRRVCFRFRIRPDRVEAYRAAHERVWPEMLEALHATGWRDYTIHLASDGTVIGIALVDDLDTALARMATTDVNARWQAAMAAFVSEGAAPDETFELLEPVFDLEAQLEASRGQLPHPRNPPTTPEET